MQKSYQLTSFPIGSKREFWAMTWPLMLGLLSSTSMIFINRLFLAKWNPLGLNAVVTAGLAYYMFTVILLGIVEIAEVLSGRLNGEERHREIGQAVWQMVLLSALATPILWLIAFFAPPLLFGDSSSFEYETTYFSILLCAAPIQGMVISLYGFFIGTGNVKFVTMSAIFGNVSSIFLDYFLIFGIGPIPSLGITGAASAIALAQCLQLIFLLSNFWSSKNRKTYGTSHLKFHRLFFTEGLRIGLPSGLARNIEILAHFIFFRLVMLVSPEQMTLVAIAQSLYILVSFIIDAQSKGTSAIVSNLLGANQHGLINKVLISGMTLHFFYFLLFFAATNSFPHQLFSLFNASGDAALTLTPELLSTFRRVLLFVSLFFLFDGFAWIMVGFLTAAKDTVYIFWISVIINWVGYIPPTVLLIGIWGGGADVAWSIIATVTVVTFALYMKRYYSKRWQKKDQARAVL